MVAAVIAIGRLLKSIESLQTDAQLLAHLPDDIRAGVMAEMIEGARLAGGVVEIHVAVADG